MWNVVVRVAPVPGGVGYTQLRRRANRGGEVGRQIGHHRTAKHKEPQEATGVQI